MTLLYYYLMPILLVVGFYDVMWRRIPNAITLPLGLLGVMMQSVAGDGLTHALLGILAGGGLFFACYLFRMMGAGDVKLMAALGAWLGVPRIFSALMLAILAGGVIALLFLARSGITQNRPVPDSATVPYGVAIAIGALLSLSIKL